MNAPLEPTSGPAGATPGVAGDELCLGHAACDPVHGALRLAYRYLNRRDHTVGEVRAYLEGRGVGAAVIGEALDVLAAQRVLDDARFVRVFAEDKRELENWGDERIRRTLQARGVDRELIATTLRAQPRKTELIRALDLLRRRFPSPPGDRRARDRALGVLLRKGYNIELALDALAAYGRGG